MGKVVLFPFFFFHLAFPLKTISKAKRPVLEVARGGVVW